MSDEIKEMNFSEMLFNRDERLLDYITNLQEENNNLKEDFKRHIDRINELTERSDNLQEENEQLEKIADSRMNTILDIEKCVEKLKENNNAKD